MTPAFRSALAVACALLITPPLHAGSAPAEAPVLVRFDALAWVYARSGLPHLDRDGTLLTPLDTTCSLIGATCERQQMTVRAHLGGASVQLPVTVHGAVTFVPLRLLARGVGLSVAWRPDARTAVVSGAGERGDLALLAGYLPRSASGAPNAALWVGVRPRSNSRVLDLLLRSEAGPLRVTSVFTKLRGGSISVTGAAAPATPDNPGVPFVCANVTGTCQVPVDRDAEYALALVP